MWQRALRITKRANGAPEPALGAYSAGFWKKYTSAALKPSRITRSPSLWSVRETNPDTADLGAGTASLVFAAQPVSQ